MLLKLQIIAAAVAMAATAAGAAYLKGWWDGDANGYGRHKAEVISNNGQVNKANEKLREQARELAQVEAQLQDLLERRKSSGVSYIVTAEDIEARR